MIRAEEQANYWKHGAGGYKSNIQDLARWAQALTNRRLLTEAGERAMWSVQSASRGDKTRLGLGFSVEDQGGLRESHSGKQDETTTRLVIYLRARRGGVVMCNSGFAAVGDVSSAVYRALDSK